MVRDKKLWGNYFQFLRGWFKSWNLKLNGLSFRGFFLILSIVALSIPYPSPNLSGIILNPFLQTRVLHSGLKMQLWIMHSLYFRTQA